MTETASFPGETVPAADGSGLVFGGEPPGWERDMEGLLILGQLTATFEWVGHKIMIKTLRTDEELIIASLVKEWGDTIGASKAYATAICALAVQHIDSQPMPAPLGETGSTNIQWAVERFRYAQRWYPTTIDIIFTRYLELEQHVREVIDNLGKALGPVAATPGSSEDSASPSGRDSSGE